MNKGEIIDNIIQYKIGPVRFKKYLLKGERDEDGSPHPYYDYDILLRNGRGKFEFSGFIEWNEEGTLVIEHENLLLKRYFSIESIFNGIFTIGGLSNRVDDHIINIMNKRIRGGRIKKVPMIKK